MEESPPKKSKKIRLTHSEAYAIGLTNPKKKKIAFWLIGLLLVAVLGNVLWHFQDAWLSYWLPTEEESGQVVVETVLDDIAMAAPNTPTPKTAAESQAALDFLSAVPWNHPRFHQGVRLFNQALDRYELFQREPKNMELLAQVAEGTRQAGRLFEGLRPIEPSSKPLDHAVDSCQRLMADVQKSRQAAIASAAKSKPQTTSRTQAPKPRIKAEDLWQHPDAVEGARLFNQALKQFNQYKANTSRKELLKPTEKMARQAAQKFEELKRQAPEKSHSEIDRHIHECYGIVSACRQQQLESGKANASKIKSFDRGTTGPSRRPVLPAYQPPQ